MTTRSAISFGVLVVSLLVPVRPALALSQVSHEVYTLRVLEYLEELVAEGYYKGESDALPTEAWFYTELPKYDNREREFEDSWGRRIVYYYPARYGDKKFDLYSFGEDGIDDRGGGDDVSNWAGYDRTLYVQRRRHRATVERLSWLATVIVLIGVCVMLSCSKLRFCFLSRCPVCRTRIKGRLFVPPPRCSCCDALLVEIPYRAELLVLAALLALGHVVLLPETAGGSYLQMRCVKAGILLILTTTALLLPYSDARDSGSPTPEGKGIGNGDSAEPEHRDRE